jgi:hypothetical protein
MKHLPFLILVFGLPLMAQQRYLVSSRNEIIPVKENESVEQAWRRKGAFRDPAPRKASSPCNPLFGFGYPQRKGPGIYFQGHHKDLFAEWFVIPVTGRIESLYWWVSGSSIGALDSTVFVSIHRSRISPDYGPGANSSNPFNAPCQQWGYYPNSADKDQGIAPFIDQASDTNWVSTVTGSLGDVPSQPPTIGPSIWGGTLGVPVIYSPGVNVLPMSRLF